jgi:hypothetical protein
LFGSVAADDSDPDDDVEGKLAFWPLLLLLLRLRLKLSS